MPDPSYPTYSRVPIEQSAGETTVLRAATAGQVVRLHHLHLTLNASGTLTIEDTAGINLTGPIELAEGTPFREGPHEWKEACLTSPSGTGLQITTSQIANGHALVSWDAN